jgi:hypothetical protein
MKVRVSFRITLVVAEHRKTVSGWRSAEEDGTVSEYFSNKALIKYLLMFQTP